MRQVNREELVYAIVGAMRGWSAALLRDLGSRVGETRARARVLAAGAIADKALHRFEVLSDGELPSVMGEKAFSRPVERMLGHDPGPNVYDENAP